MQRVYFYYEDDKLVSIKNELKTLNLTFKEFKRRKMVICYNIDNFVISKIINIDGVLDYTVEDWIDKRL